MINKKIKELTQSDMNIWTGLTSVMGGQKIKLKTGNNNEEIKSILGTRQKMEIDQ